MMRVIPLSILSFFHTLKLRIPSYLIQRIHDSNCRQLLNYHLLSQACICLQVDDVFIWCTIYGSNDSTLLLFIHGGFGQSAYWGLQVATLKSSYRCILMDSRGEGRSTLSSTGLTYDLMLLLCSIILLFNQHT